MKSIFIAFLFAMSLSSVNIYGQAFATTSGNNILKEKKYKGFEDKILLFENFKKATIVDVNNNEIADVDVNFNQLLSLFIGLYQGKELLLNEYRYRKVIVTDGVEGHEMVFVNNIDSKHPEKYFQLLFSNDYISLFKSYSAKVVESGNFNYGKGSDSNYIKKDEEYFYFLEDKLEEIDLKEKDIVKPFKRKKATIKKFVEKENLSFKNEQDVVKILKEFAEES